MSSLSKNILQEVVLSTKNNAMISGSCFEFLMPNYINFGRQNVKVGVKNIRFPKKKRTMRIKLHLAHFTEKFDDATLTEYEIEFKNSMDLCQHMEIIAWKSLGLESGDRLDFRNSRIFENGTSKFILSISFENGRIIIRKNVDYVIYISDNLENFLHFGNALPIDNHGSRYWKLKDFMHMSDYCCVDKPENDIVHLAMYDIIESSTWALNGGQYPIICTFYANNDNRGSNEFLSVKTVSVQYIKKVKCWFFNEFFENYDFSYYDLIADPFLVTLVFFEN